jgi:hypothetical protein
MHHSLAKTVPSGINAIKFKTLSEGLDTISVVSIWFSGLRGMRNMEGHTS